MIRKAKAVWRGTGRAGNGHLSTASGVLAQTRYSFKTRFENEKGTNPEELIAAAQCAPYCRRYRSAARHAEPVDTSTSHVGFRCVVRARETA